MYHRLVALLLAGLLLVPAVLEGQYREPSPRPRVSVTPLVGYRIPYDAVGDLTLYYRDGSTTFLHSRERRGGGPVYGGEVEIRMFGPFGLSAGYLHAESAENTIDQRMEIYEEHGDTEITWSGPTRGPSSHFVRAGVVIYLPEPTPDLQRRPITASITVGPAIVREVQPADPVPADYPQANHIHWDPIDHYAVHVGLRAIIPLGTPRIALRVAAENHFTFWNEAELNRQTMERFGGLADWRYGRYHLATLNAGVALRF
jgi:hypothetical protein